MAAKLATSIAGGAWLKVQVTTADNEVIDLGFAQGCSYSEDFNVQGLDVLGRLGPQEYNSFGYQCEVTIRLLVSKNKAEFDKIIPKRADVQKNGLMPDNVITFIDTSLTDSDGNPVVHNSFKGCVLNRVTENVEANQFVSGDISFMSIERTK